MRLITAGVSTVELGVCGSGTGWQGRVRVCCASETQAHTIGLEVQLVTIGWAQRHTDRFLKGCIYGSLWLDQSCRGILTMASGTGGAKGEMDNRSSEPRDSDNASPQALEKQ